MVICLEQGADLHMAHLMPLPLTDWFYLSGTGSPGSPGQRAVKWLCVCFSKILIYWREVVKDDCQARKLNTEDAMDRSKWRKLIKDVR